MAEDKNKKNQGLPGSFTVDNPSDVAQEVPSITKLLNRKAFGSNPKKKTLISVEEVPAAQAAPEAPAAAAKPEKTSTASISDIWAHESTPNKGGATRQEAPKSNSISNRGGFDEPSVEVVRTMTNLFRAKTKTTDLTEEPTDTENVKPPEAAGDDQPGVKRAGPQASPRGRTKNSPLIIWEQTQLLASRDPLGRALGDLLSRGVEAALFLTIQPPAPGAQVPHFLGSAAVAASKRRVLWTGLTWNPMLSPELWNQFVKAGQVELIPPGTATQATSVRNAVRAAFGVDPEQWLTLVRVGPAQACRGVLALVSRSSVQQAVNRVQPLLNSLPDLKAA